MKSSCMLKVVHLNECGPLAEHTFDGPLEEHIIGGYEEHIIGGPSKNIKLMDSKNIKLMDSKKIQLLIHSKDTQLVETNIVLSVDESGRKWWIYVIQTKGRSIRSE